MRLLARDCRVHIFADSRFFLLSAAAEDHRVAPHAKPLKVIWKPRPQGQKGRSSSKKCNHVCTVLLIYCLLLLNS